MGKTPAIPLSDDLVDRIAREIGIQVADHLESQYPAATKAVAWNSCKLSIKGVVRNAIAGAGRAAEQGRADEWIKAHCDSRRKLRALRRQADAIVAARTAQRGT